MPSDLCKLCPVCNVLVHPSKIGNHYKASCCKACEQFIFRRYVAKKEPKRSKRCNGECLNGKTDRRPVNQHMCAHCRYARFIALGGKPCKFRQKIKEKEGEEEHGTDGDGGGGGATNGGVDDVHNNDTTTNNDGLLRELEVLLKDWPVIVLSADVVTAAAAGCVDAKQLNEQRWHNTAVEQVCLIPIGRYISSYFPIAPNDSKQAMQWDFVLFFNSFRVPEANEAEKFGQKMLSVVHSIRTPFFETFVYNRLCACEQFEQRLSAPFRLEMDPLFYYKRFVHLFFDILIRIGWAEPITKETAKLMHIQICEAGRPSDVQGLIYMLEKNWLNPSGPKVHLIEQRLRDVYGLDLHIGANPDQCLCCEMPPVGTAHQLSNLLVLLGLAGMKELCPRYSSAANILPTEAYDLLRYFVESGKFYRYGTHPILPKRKRVDGTIEDYFGHYSIPWLDPAEYLLDDSLCFVFCCRTDERIVTTGHACYFGTKQEVFAGLSTYSHAQFYHWYFEPTLWRDQIERPPPPPLLLGHANAE